MNEDLERMQVRLAAPAGEFRREKARFGEQNPESAEDPEIRVEQHLKRMGHQMPDRKIGAASLFFSAISAELARCVCIT